MEIILTVYLDAVKAEIVDSIKRDSVGFFRDEVSAIGAVFERVLIQSAIVPCRRRLPASTVIRCEYKSTPCCHQPRKFSRGTVAKLGQGRRIVMLPGVSAKPWIIR